MLPILRPSKHILPESRAERKETDTTQMIKSMTAFARNDKTEADWNVLVEIRSYNSRHLDTALRIPGEYLALEEKIKGLISSAVSRGRIEMTLKIRNEGEGAITFEIDEPAARAYHNALAELVRMFDLKSNITIEQLTAAGGFIKPSRMDMDITACWPVVQACIETALQNLDAMRSREGDHIATDLSQRLDLVEQLLEKIETESADLIQMYRERLENRISILTNGLAEIDPGRIAQEAAFLADRSDISEEIVRSRSHIRQFRTIMSADEPAGRKLNFLLQEFNREFNTMGSKAANQKVSHDIVAAKAELEKMREQVQNVE